MEIRVEEHDGDVRF